MIRALRDFAAFAALCVGLAWLWCVTPEPPRSADVAAAQHQWEALR